jgi:cytochrome c-type biogenesis protein CcmH
MNRRWFALAVFVLPAVWAAGPAASGVQEDPLEREVLEISKTLRCAVCQNQPVSESNSDLAKDMRQIIREQLVAGKSREQIVQYFVDRYGDYVLMKPPTERAGLLLWVAPVLVFFVLFAFGWLFLCRKLAAPTEAPTLSDADRERVQAARKQLDD